MEDITAKDVMLSPPQLNFVTIRDTATVLHTLELLSRNDVSAAPVLSSNSKIVGMIDLLDLVTFACSKVALQTVSVETMEHQAKEFEKPVERITNISGRDPPIMIQTDCPLMGVVDKMMGSRAHRVILLEPETGIPQGILTQHKLIDYLFQRKKQLGLMVILESKIRELWQLGQVVETIHFKQPVLEAFMKMYDKSITGIAVVDDDGNVVTNLSASDLKRARFGSPTALIQDLLQPIQTFSNIDRESNFEPQTILSQSQENLSLSNSQLTGRERSGSLSGLPGRERSGSTSGRDRSFTPPVLYQLPSYGIVTITEDETLEKAVDLMIRLHVHRLYVTKASSEGESPSTKPIHVITLGDVLSKFRGPISK